MGTLCSVFWVFKSDFLSLLFCIKDKRQKKFLELLLVGTIPTGIMGWFWGSYFVNLFKSPLLVGFMLLFTGSLIYLINTISYGHKTINEMCFKDALWVGLFQGIAVLPGLSRSGFTIFAAISRSLDRQTAVKYSFMLSAPAILGATLLEALKLFQAEAELTQLANYLLSGSMAFVFGVIAIRYFINLLIHKKFYYFAYYCWVIGLLIVAVNFLRGHSVC